MNSVRQATLPESQSGKDVCTDMSTAGQSYDDSRSEGRYRVSGACCPADGISTLRALKLQGLLPLMFSASICIWTNRNPSLATPRELSSDLASVLSL